MEVIIPESKLKAAKACNAYLDSPEWDGEALVYSDWAATANRLMSTSAGTAYLSWLITHELVPMTRTEFKEARKARIRRG